MCCIRQQCFQTALHNALVICNHCSPSYGDGRGIAGIMCGAVTFWVAPQCRVSAGLLMLCKYTPVDFTFIKSRAMTISRSPQCWAFSRALIDEKSLSPLFPVDGVGGGGAVVTNDWCIIYQSQDQCLVSVYREKIQLSSDITRTAIERLQ